MGGWPAEEHTFRHQKKRRPSEKKLRADRVAAARQTGSRALRVALVVKENIGEGFC